MTDDFAERLKRLEAAETARNAINKYCLALDRPDLTILETLFSRDITLRGYYVGRLEGREDALAYFAKAVSTPCKHRKHYTTNSIVEGIDGDIVTAQCYFFSCHGDPEKMNVAWGHYEYKVRLQSDGGEICDLNIILDQPVTPIGALEPAT